MSTTGITNKEQEAKKLEEGEKPKTKGKETRAKDTKAKKSHGPPPKPKEVYVGEQPQEEVKEPEKKMYIIPVQEVSAVKKKPTKGKGKGKKKEESKSTAYDPGIKIIKDRESLAVKFPKYTDYRIEGREERLEEKKKFEEENKGKTKKAPINVGSTRIT